MLRHRKVKIQLLFVLLLAIVPFLLFIFYLFDLWYDTSRTTVLNANITHGRLIGQFIHDSIKAGENSAVMLATDPIAAKLMTNEKEGTQILKNVVANQPELYAANVWDINGKLVISSLALEPEQRKATIINREYFQTAVKTQKPSISEALTGLLTGENLVIMAAPIIQKGEVAGVVNTSYNLKYLKQSIEKTMSNYEKDIVILIDNKGQIVFMQNRQFPVTDADRALLVNEDFVKQALNGKITSIENKFIPSIDTGPLMGASVPITDLGWAVVHLEPTDNIFTPLLSLQKIVWMIILSALIFALALISYFLRKIKIVYC